MVVASEIEDVDAKVRVLKAAAIAVVVELLYRHVGVAVDA
jgi:hypothetical protein